jgi:hypothetical protein
MGFTGFTFNHSPWFQPNENIIHTRRLVDVPSSLDRDKKVDTIMAQMGIFGYVPSWEQKIHENGDFLFTVIRPGRQYSITLNALNTEIDVKENFPGIINLLQGMHPGSIGGPPSVFFSIWRIYTYSCSVLAIIVLFISVYYWFRKSVKRNAEWIFISLSSVFTLMFFFYIWLIG